MSINISGSDALGLSEFYTQTNRFSAREYEDWLSKKFISPEGLIKDKFVKAHEVCPVCHVSLTRSNRIFIKEGYVHWRCENCESIYTNPSLKDEVIRDDVYGKTIYPFLESVNSPTQIEFDRLRFSRALDKLIISGMSVNQKGVMDFGCGSGFFLSLCRELGFKDLFGNDLLHQAVELAHGLHSLNQVSLKDGLDDLNRIDENVSLVALWEFLDHINEPKLFMDKLFSSISSGTYVIISVRNADSLAARILRAQCNMFLGHAHFNFWSNKTVDSISSNYHCETVDSYQYISEREVVCNFLNYQNSYTGNGQELDWMPSKDDILKQRMGYKHVLLLRKK
jgi:2-polyprenyl-3-methyl-5-hydroxy-6-metoxy-1,4-benzoquinol methylase